MSKMFAEGQPCHKGVGHEGALWRQWPFASGRLQDRAAESGFAPNPEPRTRHGTPRVGGQAWILVRERKNEIQSATKGSVVSCLQERKITK